MADTLTTEEIATLTKVAGLMIPPSTAYNVPGADDPAIVQEIVADANKNVAEPMKAALAAWTATDAADDAARVAAFTKGEAENAGLLQTVVNRVYYRDDRVMVSLGMEPRAPFPKGFEVEESDWSILDPVRKRGDVWRKVK